MRALASFASSESGKLYGRVCHYWGIDPAAPIPDDVLAFNLRAALMLSLVGKDETDDPASESRELANKAREKGAALRAALDG